MLKYTNSVRNCARNLRLDSLDGTWYNERSGNTCDNISDIDRMKRIFRPPGQHLTEYNTYDLIRNSPQLTSHKNNFFHLHILTEQQPAEMIYSLPAEHFDMNFTEIGPV